MACTHDSFAPCRGIEEYEAALTARQMLELLPARDGQPQNMAAAMLYLSRLRGVTVAAAEVDYATIYRQQSSSMPS